MYKIIRKMLGLTELSFGPAPADAPYCEDCVHFRPDMDFSPQAHGLRLEYAKCAAASPRISRNFGSSYCSTQRSTVGDCKARGKLFRPAVARPTLVSINANQHEGTSHDQTG